MGFIEFISPGALSGIDLSQTMLLYNHKFENILARADAGNLTLKVDQTGLFFDAQLPNTTLANDVVADIQAGNLKGCSFGFTLPDDCSGDDWTQDEQGNLIHTISQFATIAEVSITAIPAYTQTSVAVQRSLENYKKGVQERDMAEKNNSTVLDAIKALAEQVRALKQAQDDADKDKDKNKSADDPAEDEDAKDNGKSAKRDDDDGGDLDDRANGQDKDKDQSKDESAEDDDKDPADNQDQGSDNQDKSKQNNKGDRKHMPKDITPENQAKVKEVRSLEKFLRTGKRDADTVGGFDTTAGEAVIPSQVLDVLAQPNDPTLLAGYVNRVQVTAPTGKLPVLARATATLATAAELAENPAIANATITPVTYDLETLRGALPISIEMTQDYPNILSLLTDYVQTVKDRTEQRKIGAVLQQATPVSASTIDDIKGVYNSNDLVWYQNKVVVTTASGYDWLDTQKDDNGRYLLQDSIAVATGKTLFGAQVIEVADDVLGGGQKMFIGDPKSFVLETLRANLNVAWVRNEQFEQVLQVVLRADFKVADKDAGKFITVGAASTSTTTASAAGK